jgi:proline iminopeptidase
MRRDLEENSEESGAEWQRFCAPYLCIRPDDLHDALERLRIRTPDVNHHFQGDEARTMDLTPDLARVRCPVLVLVGERDPLIPIELAREAADAVPDGLGRLVAIPDASHELLVDAPDAVFATLREFLAHTAGRAGPQRAPRITRGSGGYLFVDRKGSG